MENILEQSLVLPCSKKENVSRLGPTIISTMNISVRPAVKEDCPRIMELVHELAVYEKAPEQVTVSMKHFVESGFGNNPIWWALVATTKDGANNSLEIIQGFALYYIRYSTWKGQAMYLEDLLVTESMRGHGIGYALFENLVEEARKKKFNRIIWQVLDWNEPAIKFYKKLNASFDPEWINCSMDIPLD
jgi:GNAT superfamily N-acetyltransferase